MNKEELDTFLDNKPGYVKKGSKTLIQILQEKGYSLVGLTNDQIKEVLKNKVAARKAAKKLAKIQPLKILVYDIETTLVEARIWGSGKQYVGHDRIANETQILTVAFKWLGSNTMQTLVWKKNNDKKLMEEFLKTYNQADMVMGWNNNQFDNKLINARAMKHGLEVNTFVKSFDIMRQVKKQFKLASYSMAYVSRYLGLGGKLQHNGIKMWDTIQWGTKADAKQELQNMVAYNVQDTQLTEDIYMVLRPYLTHVVHQGVNANKGKCSCPNCATKKTKLYQTQYTAAGTVQRVMKCKKCKTPFKVSNTEYLKTI